MLCVHFDVWSATLIISVRLEFIPQSRAVFILYLHTLNSRKYTSTFKPFFLVKFALRPGIAENIMPVHLASFRRDKSA